MKNTIKALALIALIGGIGSAGNSYAATQGTLGATSTGTSVVTMSIAEAFQVSDIADIPLGAYSGTGDLNGNDDLCVYHNGDGSYRVTVTDSSTISAAAFAVEDAGNANEIAMSVFWNDTTGTVGEAAVTDGTAITTLTGANTTISDCSAGGLSANIHVTLLEAALQAAPAGSYDSTLTIVVEAD